MEIFKRKKNSQQLIEFLLVAPFLVIILGILTEYAYALNINMTIEQALKAVTSSYCSKDISGTTTCYSIYNQIKPGMDKQTIRTNVSDGFVQYLNDNNVPTNPKNNIDIGYTEVGQTAVFIANYTYIPAFTLPNVFFKFLPDEFNFFATAAVPSTFLRQNNYNSAITSTQLDGIWGASDFSSLNKFEDSKKGIIKEDDTTTGYGRSSILFFTPSAPGSTDENMDMPYDIQTWDGSYLQYKVDMSSSSLFICELTLKGIVCNDTHMPLCPFMQNNRYASGLFLHDSVEMTVSMRNGSGYSRGNYDSINVSAYNSNVSGINTTEAKYCGSTIFVSTSTLESTFVDRIISMCNHQQYPYNFGD